MVSVNENSLYTSDAERKELLKDGQKVANAFWINFLGTLGLFKISSKRGTMRNHFQDDEKIGITLIGDGNKDVSLVVRLFVDAGGVRAPVATKILKLMNLIKMRKITHKNLEDDLVRQLAADINLSAKRPHPMIVSIVEQFINGDMDLKQATKALYELVKTRKKDFMPVSGEWYNLAKQYLMYFKDIDMTTGKHPQVLTIEPIGLSVEPSKELATTKKPEAPKFDFSNLSLVDEPALTAKKEEPKEEPIPTTDSLKDRVNTLLGRHIEDANVFAIAKDQFDIDVDNPEHAQALLDFIVPVEDDNLFMFNVRQAGAYVMEETTYGKWVKSQAPELWALWLVVKAKDESLINTIGILKRNGNALVRIRPTTRLSGQPRDHWYDAFVKSTKDNLKEFILDNYTQPSFIQDLKAIIGDLEDFDAALVQIANWKSYKMDDGIINASIIISGADDYGMAMKASLWLKKAGADVERGSSGFLVVSNYKNLFNDAEDIISNWIPHQESHKTAIIFADHEVTDEERIAELYTTPQIFDDLSKLKDGDHITTAKAVARLVVELDKNYLLNFWNENYYTAYLKSSQPKIIMAFLQTIAKEIERDFKPDGGIYTYNYLIRGAKETDATYAAPLNGLLRLIIQHDPSILFKIGIDEADAKLLGISIEEVVNGGIRIFDVYQAGSMMPFIHFIPYLQKADLTPLKDRIEDKKDMQTFLEMLGKSNIDASLYFTNEELVAFVGWAYSDENTFIQTKSIGAAIGAMSPADRERHKELLTSKMMDGQKLNHDYFLPFVTAFGEEETKNMFSQLPIRLDYQNRTQFLVYGSREQIQREIDEGGVNSAIEIFSSKGELIESEIAPKWTQEELIALLQPMMAAGAFERTGVESFFKSILTDALGASEDIEPIIRLGEKAEGKAKDLIFKACASSYRLATAIEDIKSDQWGVKPDIELTRSRLAKVLAFNDIDVSDVVFDSSKSFRDNLNTLTQYQLQKLDVTKVEKSQEELDKTTIEYDKFNAGLHGNIGVEFLEEFNVNIPIQNEEGIRFLEDVKHRYPNNVTMSPVFHGTGSVGASMVLRYGFRVISGGDSSVVGRMLGDGIYFSDVLDKVAQYVGDGGYSRKVGMEGYIFGMVAQMGEPKVDYVAAGVPDDPANDEEYDTISPEWCVFNPNGQLKITKAWRVRLVTRSSIKELKVKRGINEEARIKSFNGYLTEASKKDFRDTESLTLIFRDGMIPVSEKETVDFTKVGKLPNGVVLQATMQGPAITIYGVMETESVVIRHGAGLSVTKYWKDYAKALKIRTEQ